MASSFTAAESALAKQAAQNWNSFVTDFLPVQDHLWSVVSDMNGPRQTAGVDAMSKGMDSAQVGVPAASGLLAAVQNPDSSVALGDQISRANQFRHGLGAAFGATEPALYDRKIGGALAIDAVDRGLQSGSMTSLGDVASRTATAQAENDALNASMRNSMVSSLFSGLGMYAGAKNLFGTK